MRGAARSTRAGGLAALALLVLSGATANAQKSVLPPSEHAACLILPADAVLKYPQEALERRDGGTVRVELEFVAADKAPRVEYLEPNTFNSLELAVRRHVERYRMPCLPKGHAPVKLRQEYVFTPNDGRKVVVTDPREADAVVAARQRQMACMKPLGKPDLPEYTEAARRVEEQGVVLVSMSFEHPDKPPAVKVLSSPPGRELLKSVLAYTERLRMPCLEGTPVSVTTTYRFVLDGGNRILLNDMSLQTFVQSAARFPEGVFFDTNAMGCPFDLRVTYWRPHFLSEVGQLGSARDERKAFMNWLSRIELRLSKEVANAVLGGEFVLRIPCLVVDL